MQNQHLSKAHPSGAVLVVDLDGTLLRSDLQFERFWSAFGRDWRGPFRSVRALLSGRAALETHLATAARVDVATLPYDPTVIAYIDDWRAQGGRTALLAAGDPSIAEDIARHLKIFDAVHGGAARDGAEKAARIAALYGPGGYAYMGDEAADLPAWRGAAKAITVNVPESLREKADSLDTEVEHLAGAPRALHGYIRALRPHQWAKNALVFLPMLAAHRFTLDAVALSALAFVAFSLVASSVYVVNDLLDLAADRAHPRKRNRPFASGAAPVAHGAWLALGLLVAGMAIASFAQPLLALVIAFYYVLTIAYGLHLKRRPVIDIFALAGLYTIRIVAGSVAADIPLSVWLLGFSLFFFFSLAAVKRQAELVDSARRGKLGVSGRGYHVDDLSIVSMIGLGAGYVSVLVMLLYVNSPDVLKLYPHPVALWGVCCVLLYWVTRMVMVTHRGAMHDDPLVFAVTDRVSQASFLLILAFAVAGAWR